MKLAAGVVGGVVALGAGLLVVGLLIMSSRSGSEGIAHAPDGRTGDETIDEIVDAFLAGDADGLRSRFRLVPARSHSADFEQIVFSTDEWTAMLAVATRELYSVSTGDPSEAPAREVDIVIRVAAPGGLAIPWRISVADGRVVDLTIGREGDSPSSYSPSVARQYDQFLVLPSHDDLPQPPPGHDLSVSTGNRGVDELVALLRRQDSAGLLGAALYEEVPCTSPEPPHCPAGAASGTPVDALPVRNCGVFSGPHDAQFTQAWLTQLAEKSVSVHAVVVLPAGYRPAGDHLLIVVTREEPYRWEISALVERQGRVVSVVTTCGGDSAHQLYPPAAFTVAPPGDDSGTLTGRLADLTTALGTASLVSLGGLIDYEPAGCAFLSDGVFGPPRCRPEEAPGTLVDVVVAAGCEGHYVRREDVPAMLEALGGSSWKLYAALDLGSADPGPFGFGRGRTQAVFTRDTGIRPSAVAFSLSDGGITSVRFPATPE